MLYLMVFCVLDIVLTPLLIGFPLGIWEVTLTFGRWLISG